MVLIAMCVYSTEENRKDECLEKTLLSLKKTTNLINHRLFLSINGKTEKTMDIITKSLEGCPYTVIDNGCNLGTAKGINKCWVQRHKGEHCIKMDDDIEIWDDVKNWIEILEEAVRRDPQIGQIGLKRVDCFEDPSTNSSSLHSLPKKPGERWIHIEKAQHIIGSCVLHSSDLIDKTGGLFQMDGLYGFDDCLKSHVSILAGFYNCFYPHILIAHIDPSISNFQDWKVRYAGERFKIYEETVEKLKNRQLSWYFEFT
jgi:GT2 family glycosyltransferase